jgi:hypothetical protein
LFALLARRHTGVRGELFPSDLHFDNWVGTQVQIPTRVRIGPALGPDDDKALPAAIKHRRRGFCRSAPDRGEQQAGTRPGRGDRRKQMPFSSSFAINPQVLSDPVGVLPASSRIA